MRNAIILIYIILTSVITSQAQDGEIINQSDNTLSFTSIEVVDSASKEELYSRAKLWLAQAFINSNEVTRIDDDKNGIIMAKAMFYFSPKRMMAAEQIVGPVRYQVMLSVKEGRYKIEVTNFVHDPAGNEYGKVAAGLITTSEPFPYPKRRAITANYMNKLWNEIKILCKEEADLLIASAKQGMLVPLDNDW